VKSLAQIDEYQDGNDRVSHLSRLLEYLLKSISPATLDKDMKNLLIFHREKFSDYDQVKDAQRVRNELTLRSGAHPHRSDRVASVGIPDASIELGPLAPPFFI
jgi:hypothetical protein